MWGLMMVLLTLMVLLSQGCITTEMLSVDPAVKQTVKQQADIVLKATEEAEKTYEDFVFALDVARDELTSKSDKNKEDFTRLAKIVVLEKQAEDIYKEYTNAKAGVKNLIEVYTSEDDEDLQVKVDELNRIIRRMAIEFAIRSAL
jgi:hypothetical protein